MNDRRTRTPFALACLAAALAAQGAAAQPRPTPGAKSAPTCGAGRPSKKRHRALKAAPRLGRKLYGLPKSNDWLMTGSGGLQAAYEVCHGGVHYTVAADGDGVIRFVSTSEPSFRTPEGVAAGDTLEKVLAAAKSEVSREPGWAFFVRLPSGWAAAFTQGESMTEGELRPTAKVNWLFKR